MIIHGSKRIYPREIEEVLLTYPHVAGAHLFGVTDNKFCKEVCA